MQKVASLESVENPWVVAGSSSNGGGDNADGGEKVGLVRKLLPVT
jgi:hypothetical protein